ncbi:MAG: ATP-binding cassette domain-containing protein [Rhodospirillales bacterium]|nr:ATP-binding cassette domain-containing protein [Rhodospirillales bacterium]
MVEPFSPTQAERPVPLLRVRDLRLTVPSPAGAVNILRGVDLDVGAGESLAILGPSGSGKTSLMMLIAGLERASAGSIALAGQEIAAAPEPVLAALRLRRIGIVFQSFHLMPALDALENVALPLALAGHADASATARAALAAVGLSHRLTHLPGQLSGGEQQRVAIARAMAPRPALLLADEPTGNLDQETGAAVMDTLFARQRDSGAALLLITHDPALAARCARQVRMAEGTLREVLPA